MSEENTATETNNNTQPETAAPAPAENTPQLQPEVDIEHFMKVELRVARIEAAEAVPKSKKLLKLSLDLGPLGKRQIVSGIANFYTPETLVGKRIVVVANLKAAKLMGVESHGMLLAASSDNDSALYAIEIPESIPLGSRVR